MTDGYEVVSGQQFRLNIRVNKEVWLYVFTIGSRNIIWTVFPKNELIYRNPLKPNISYSIPSDIEDLMYEFDNNIGLEKFYFFVSDKIIPDFEDLLKQITANGMSLTANINLKSLLEQKKPDLQAIDSKVAIARIKEMINIRGVRGQTFKINPLLILCKRKYAKKIVLLHKASVKDLLSPKIKKQAAKEQWPENNVLTQKDIQAIEK